MPTVMIIGASRGIGLELARQYACDGWRVHATTRTPKQPGQLDELSGEVVLHQLDVRCVEQIANLADAVQDEGIDVLIHNAGVSGRGQDRQTVMTINAQAPIRVTLALLDAVQRGKQKKIIWISSQLGARHGSTRSLGTYGDSKAALNDALRKLAPAWGRQGLIAIVMHPGWVRTDMGGRGAPLSVEESASGIRQVIANLGAAQHGGFWTWDGRRHAW